MIILYEQENGNIAMVHPSASYTLENLLREVPEGARHRVSADNLLPNDKDLSEFFDALRVNFDKELDYFYFDIKIAREITKNRLRRERVEKFQENDILLRDAVIDNDNEKLSRGIFERDRLRDITQLPDNVSSLEELRNLHP
jgi:hypothetical protein